MRLVLSMALFLTVSANSGTEAPRNTDIDSPTPHGLAHCCQLREPQPLTLRRMIHDSALIFSGTVLRVEHLRPQPNSSVEISHITFRVQNAIRGTRPGQVIQIREWGGLWNAGERYATGQRVLLFLYPSSKLGLTSPIGGTAGLFQIDKIGRVQIAKGKILLPRGTLHSGKVPVRQFAAAIRRAAGE